MEAAKPARAGRRKPSGDAAPPKGTGPKPGAAARRGSGKRALAETLAREVQGLRVALRETLEQYTARVDGDLAAVLARLEGDGASPMVPPTATSREALGRIGTTKLKPEKGRAKDLARLQKLTEDIAALIDAG